MLVYLRGAGDIASGIAVRLRGAGCGVVMGDIAAPTSIRRTVCFSEAIRLGCAQIEGIRAEFAHDALEARSLVERGVVAVAVDPKATLAAALSVDALVDAILAKRNLGTSIDDAPTVVGVGPGFCAPLDCHAVVETRRGHYLGRVIYEGSAEENTGIPGVIAGCGAERVLRAPATGVFEPILEIGMQVRAGDVAASVDGTPLHCTIDGVLRGLLAPGIKVDPGMKVGDIDPRGDASYCVSVSDKARAVGGGVLEALLYGTGALR